MIAPFSGSRVIWIGKNVREAAYWGMGPGGGTLIPLPALPRGLLLSPITFKKNKKRKKKKKITRPGRSPLWDRLAFRPSSVNRGRQIVFSAGD